MRTKPTFADDSHPLNATYEALWAELVPSCGKCDTVEGECLRAVSRIYYDYTNNGFGNNWTGALAYLDEHVDVPRKVWAVLKPYAKGRVVKTATYDPVRDPILVALDKLMVIVVTMVSSSTERRVNNVDMHDLSTR